GSVTEASTEVYLARVVELRKKAEALGGRLSALGSQSVAFDFAVEDLEEAVELAVSGRDAREGPAPLGVAIAQGDMVPLAEAGSHAVLSWGPPLVRAIALARLARRGEVLIEPEIPSVAAGEVLTLGSRAGKDGGRRVRALVIDTRQAFRRE